METHPKIEPFASLGCRRRDRPKCIRELVQGLLDAGLQLLVVITKPSLGDPVKSLSSNLPKGRGFRIYAVTEPQEIGDAVRLLVGMPLWHKPIFHVLIGGSELKRRVVDRFGRDPGALLTDIEEELRPYVHGYLDPVDDELECYGGERLQGVLGLLSSWTVTPTLRR